MKKMILSLSLKSSERSELKKALVSSVFFTLLFVCIGNVAFAQVSTTSLSPEAIVILKEHNGQYLGKTAALNVLSEELATINGTVPANANEEKTLALKKLFVIEAGKSIKADVDMNSSLQAGYSAVVAGKKKFKGTTVSPLVLLEFYADLLSN